MLDTIVLRLKNLQKYAATINTLYSTKKEARTKVFSDSQDFSRVDNTGVIKMVYNNSGIVLPLHHRSSVHIASSHYSLSYLVSFEKDYVEFNFSIPKFIWGTNLCQFVDYYDQSAERTFRKLMEFLSGFFKLPYFVDPIDMEDVEINRIDFCYNQIFQSKYDLKVYLDYQIAKFGKKMVRHKEESIYEVFSRYSFKIYHKGPEFFKNDLQQLMGGYGKRGRQGLGDRRNQGNPNGYDLSKLQEISDRILRYEITFRNSFFNYAFQKMYFDDSKVRRNGVYRTLYRQYRIDGADSMKLLQKNFFVKSRYDYWQEIKDRYEDSKEGWPFQYKGDHNVTFDFNMFNYLYLYFRKYVKRFQVTGTVSPFEFENRLKYLNDDIEVRNSVRSTKIDKRNIKRLLHYALISKDRDLKELVDDNLLSRSQYYRILADFKRVGLSGHNPDMSTVVGNLDYQDYKYYFGNMHLGKYIK